MVDDSNDLETKADSDAPRGSMLRTVATFVTGVVVGAAMVYLAPPVQTQPGSAGGPPGALTQANTPGGGPKPLGPPDGAKGPPLPPDAGSTGSAAPDQGPAGPPAPTAADVPASPDAGPPAPTAADVPASPDAGPPAPTAADVPASPDAGPPAPTAADVPAPPDAGPAGPPLPDARSPTNGSAPAPPADPSAPARPGRDWLADHLDNAEDLWNGWAERAEASSNPKIQALAADMRKVAGMVPERHGERAPPLHQVVALLVEERRVYHEMREAGMDTTELKKQLKGVLRGE